MKGFGWPQTWGKCCEKAKCPPWASSTIRGTPLWWHSLTIPELHISHEHCYGCTTERTNTTAEQVVEQEQRQGADMTTCNVTAASKVGRRDKQHSTHFQLPACGLCKGSFKRLHSDAHSNAQSAVAFWLYPHWHCPCKHILRLMTAAVK